MKTHPPPAGSPGGRTAVRARIAALLLVLVLAAGGTRLNGQDRHGFDLTLSIDYRAAEETLRLLRDEYVDTGHLASLPGNRIAASTTGLISGSTAVSRLLRSYLDSLRDHQIIENDVYRLEEARRNTEAIAGLVGEMIMRNFNRSVIATVEQVFPADADISGAIPVHVVALGHGNADAYVRRIVWEGDTPRFSGGEEGELTIVINVAAAAAYPGDTSERLRSLLMTVAHEVFHVAFGLYQESSPAWQRYLRRNPGPLYELIGLVQNEGIAYYLSLEQRIGRSLPPDWQERMRESFRIFNTNAERLMKGNLPGREIAGIIHSANLSGYWESYGSMVGMQMARAVDLGLGRKSLIETISNGPLDLLSKYNDLSETDSSLPPISPSLLRKLGIK